MITSLAVKEDDPEIWIPIKDWENYYLISNHGRIKSLSRYGHPDRIITPSYSPIGYLIIGFSIKRKYKYFYFHRLYAQTFLPNPNNLPCVNHKDGNKLNNNLSNLEWCTFKHNSQHAVENGLMKIRGENNHGSILKEDEVLEIFHSSLTIYELAKIYNVAPITICQIRTGRSWSFLTGKKYIPKYSHLSPEEILEIFNYCGTIKETMARFNIGSCTVKLIRSGRKYSEITGKKYIPKDKKLTA